MKSVTNNPYSKRGGIIGILALFRTVLMKDQYLFLEVPGLVVLCPQSASNLRISSSVFPLACHLAGHSSRNFYKHDSFSSESF